MSWYAPILEFFGKRTTISLLEALGLHAAGRALPYAILTNKVLVEIDDEMEKEALENVRKANRLPGDKSPILALNYEPFQGTKNLEKEVKENGGTAWVQVGGNRRLGNYWHPSATFEPLKGEGCSLGHVIHGDRDADGR